MTFRKILAAYDGSDTSKRALATALSIACLHRGKLDLISVKASLPQYVPLRQEGAVLGLEKVDEYFCRLQREAITVAGEAQVLLHPYVVEGHEVEAVISVVKEHQVDLLVIGLVGHSNILQRV